MAMSVKNKNGAMVTHDARQAIMMHKLFPQWQQHWNLIQAKGDGEAIFKLLISAYSEPHRHYHNLQHLNECIQLLDEAMNFAVHPGEVAQALWFHDSIYELSSTTNELNSARWAAQALRDSAVDETAVARVYELIMATQHNYLPTNEDQQLVVDIDLAILGAPQQRFDEYEQQIRAEYSFVPNGLFRYKRRAILQSFLQRRSIYSTVLFRNKFEQAARDNLNRALSRPQ